MLIIIEKLDLIAKLEESIYIEYIFVTCGLGEIMVHEE
jgi:hypothetical protein